MQIHMSLCTHMWFQTGYSHILSNTAFLTCVNTPLVQGLISAVENGRIDVISCPDVNEIGPGAQPVPAQSVFKHLPSRLTTGPSVSAQTVLILTHTDVIGSKIALERVGHLLSCDVTPTPQISRLQNSSADCPFLLLLLPERHRQCLSACPGEVALGWEREGLKVVLPVDVNASGMGKILPAPC